MSQHRYSPFSATFVCPHFFVDFPTFVRRLGVTPTESPRGGARRAAIGGVRVRLREGDVGVRLGTARRSQKAGAAIAVTTLDAGHS